ncbi:response regulator transcription factor [[Actinomadura] parvosata]|uniref:response regulator transcription factor n=1 Tax=[Actinomadura] parvosata TaxID=1955412 RepID=UPI00406CA539
MKDGQERAAHELRALPQGAVGVAELGAAISAAIGPWVPHDALRLVGTSPATGLGQGSFSFWHRYEEELVRSLLARRATGHGDPCRPAALARRRVPAAVARGAEGGGELRVLLRDGRGVWGLLGLVRAGDARPFCADDVRRAVQLGPALMTLLRRHVTAAPLAPTIPALPAGLITVSAGQAIRTVTPQAQAWLDRLGRQGTPGWLMPAVVAALALDARANVRRTVALDTRAGVHSTACPSAEGTAAGAGRSLVCAPPAGFGRWLMIEGQALDADGTGDVAVVIQSPAAALVLPSFCDWYALTPRERQVLELLCRGTAPKQVARLLGLSAHTVHDHLKALFRKTGAGGRDELMAAFTA